MTTPPTPTHAEILGWLDSPIPDTSAYRQERRMRSAIRNLIASLTPTKMAEELADKISSHLGIMKAGGKEFVAWEDRGLTRASEYIQSALTAAELSGYERGRAEAFEEAANLILNDRVKYLTFTEAAEAIRALATQPAPEHSEPMRSAEHWAALWPPGMATKDYNDRQKSFIRAIQTNAASAAEPLLEEAMLCVKDFVYLTTHLSPEEDDGSHKCRIPKCVLDKARAVLEKRVKA